MGSRYGEPYRLLVCSLDRGRGSLGMEDRRQEIEETGVHGLNPHMYGTLWELSQLLEMRATAAVWKHFAMINTAKCSTRDGTMKSHDSATLFKNCARYTVLEVEALQPHLLVTQGRRSEIFLGGRERPMARRLLDDVVAEVHGRGKAAKDLPGIERLSLYSHSRGSAVVFKTVHPSAWQRNAWEIFRREQFGGLAPVAKALAIRASGNRLG